MRHYNNSLRSRSADCMKAKSRYIQYISADGGFQVFSDWTNKVQNNLVEILYLITVHLILRVSLQLIYFKLRALHSWKPPFISFSYQ
jgi:hypothetical protein